MVAKGRNGTVTFDGNFVTIDRTGFLARATVGKGQKRIPVRSITAVQVKPPGVAVGGFIQFTLSGGSERRSSFGSQTRSAVDDENSIIIGSSSQLAMFRNLQAAVEKAIVDAYAGHAPTVVHQAAPQPDVIDQLRRLGELRDSGVITHDEFEAQKQSLLGRL